MVALSDREWWDLAGRGEGRGGGGIAIAECGGQGLKEVHSGGKTCPPGDELALAKNVGAWEAGVDTMLMMVRAQRVMVMQHGLH